MPDDHAKGDEDREQSALDLARSAAQELGHGDWQIELPDELPQDEPAELPEPQEASPAERPATWSSSPAKLSPDRDPPPPPEQIAEAMLFVGGRPLTPAAFATAVRVPAEELLHAIDRLNQKYKSQNRPYAIRAKDGGYVLEVKSQYRGLRERLYGGPKEARLSQPALDVLALIAYRQPIAKADIDAIRGHDSSGIVRQLVRLGLVVVSRRGESGQREVSYGTTSRFLDLFELTSLEDLPRLSDAERV